ncbi:ComEC/Rec2 family competence protein [Candidatus Bipolaricaulota bacterium]
MTYAITWIALSLGVGIAVSPYLPIPTAVLWIAMACVVLATIIAWEAPRRLRMAGLILAALTLGMLRSSMVPVFPDWLIRRAPGIEDVAGTISTYPDIGDNSISFTLAPIDMPGRLLVSWTCDQPLGRFHFGDVVQVSGSTRLPEIFDGFDYPAYLSRRNIIATMFADSIALVDGASGAFSLWEWGDRLRQRLLRRFRETLPSGVSAMAQSLMFGDRSALPTDTEEAFSRTGLMHLLAVSGLHLGIFLGGAWWGLRRLGLRPRLAYPIVGVLVLLALMVVGPRVSLVRAGLLFAFLALGSVLADCGLILRRWIHPLNGLAAAAITILIIRSGALYDVGFQLTVAATGSIIIAFSPSGWGTRLVSGSRATRLWKGWHWVLGLLLVSAAAQAGAAPIIAWHFRAFHPLSILVNLIAVPLAGISLWAGLFSIPLMATRVFAAATIPFALLLRWLELLVKWLARIPIAELTVRPGMGVWMAGCTTFIYLAGYYCWLSSWTSNSTSIVLESAGD